MVWEHLRRFLVVWIVIIVALIIGSLAIYGSEIMVAMSSNAWAWVKLLITAGVVIGIIVTMIKGLF